MRPVRSAFSPNNLKLLREGYQETGKFVNITSTKTPLGLTRKDRWEGFDWHLPGWYRSRGDDYPFGPRAPPLKWKLGPLPALVALPDRVRDDRLVSGLWKYWISFCPVPSGSTVGPVQI